MNNRAIELLQRRIKITRTIFLSLIFSMVMGLYILVLSGYHNTDQQSITTGCFDVKPANTYADTVDYQDTELVQNIDVSVDTFQELKSTFTKYDSINKIISSYMRVPRLCLISLPKNFRQAPISSKKKLFVKSLLPLILTANENILNERRQLLEIISYYGRFKKLKITHKKWLAASSMKYRIKKMNLNELKKRIDIIPPSLALGQAIIETGWGTSHSAMVKNSTFGLTVDDRVLSYDSLLASVENYMLNMNAHNAYNKMREIRSEMRASKQKICSIALLKGLNSYSIRRGAYLNEIKSIINNHNLTAYDNAKLINVGNML